MEKKNKKLKVNLTDLQNPYLVFSYTYQFFCTTFLQIHIHNIVRAQFIHDVLQGGNGDKVTTKHIIKNILDERKADEILLNEKFYHKNLDMKWFE